MAGSSLAMTGVEGALYLTARVTCGHDPRIGWSQAPHPHNGKMTGGPFMAIEGAGIVVYGIPDTNTRPLPLRYPKP